MALPLFKSIIDSFTNTERHKNHINAVKVRELNKNLDAFFAKKNMGNRFLNIDNRFFLDEAVPMLDAWFAISPKSANDYIYQKTIEFSSRQGGNPLLYDLLVQYFLSTRKTLPELNQTGTSQLIEHILTQEGDKYQKIFLSHYDLSLVKKIELLAKTLSTKNFSSAHLIMENLYENFVSQKSQQSSSSSTPLAHNPDLAIVAILLVYSQNFIIQQNSVAPPNFFHPNTSQKDDSYRLYLTCLKLFEKIDYDYLMKNFYDSECVYKLVSNLEPSGSGVTNVFRPRIKDDIGPSTPSFMQTKASLSSRLDASTLYAILHNDLDKFKDLYLFSPDFDKKIEALFPAHLNTVTNYKDLFYRAMFEKVIKTHDIKAIVALFNIIPLDFMSKASIKSSLHESIQTAFSKEHYEYLDFIGHRGKEPQTIVASYPSLTLSGASVLSVLASIPLPLSDIVNKSREKPNNLFDFVSRINLSQAEINEVVSLVINVSRAPLYDSIKHLHCTEYPHKLIISKILSYYEASADEQTILKDIFLKENTPEFYLVAHEKEMIKLKPDLIEYLEILKEKKEVEHTLKIISDYKESLSLEGSPIKNKSLNKI